MLEELDLKTEFFKYQSLDKKTKAIIESSVFINVEPINKFQVQCTGCYKSLEIDLKDFDMQWKDLRFICKKCNA